MTQLSDHFDSVEFECRCGCGADEMDPAFIAMLEKARTIAGIPFPINCGVRCRQHNMGVSNSAHLTGHAADICVTNSNQRFLIVKALMEAGFRRIETSGGTWVHADNDSTKPQDVLF